MRVNVVELKNDIYHYQNIIKEYEEIYIRMYHELSSATTYWHDPHAYAYFKEIDIERQKVKTTLYELTTLQEIYIYMIDSYSKLGKIIEWNLNDRSKIIKSLEEYIGKLRQIIKQYNNLNITNLEELKDSMLQEKEKLTTTLNLVNDYLQQIQKSYNRLIQIETDVKFRLSKLKVGVIVKKLFGTYNR